MSKYTEALKMAEGNHVVFESLQKANEILNNSGFQNIMVSVSGGSDSDIMMDMCERICDIPVRYVFFDTGIEYNATREHLDELEEKYEVTIEREDPIMSIPASVRKHGVPFLSKYVSEQMERLQKHNFQFKDIPYDELYDRFWVCNSSIKWFCNEYTSETSGTVIRFNIDFNKYLKDFVIENPPDFDISNKCCDHAKKMPSKRYCDYNDIDLKLIGVRKAEGGVRSSTYKSCFIEKSSEGVSTYMPLFWYKNEDKEFYCNTFGVTHSRCYTEYGMKRTGCVGCPYNMEIFDELKTIKKYEPLLYKAAMNIFGESYIYTKKYRDYQEMRNAEN